MLEVAQTELLSVPGLNSSRAFGLQWLREVWGRETCLLCTFEDGLFDKRRLEQLRRMKAKKGHDHSLQNSREKWNSRSNQTEGDETCLCKRTILAWEQTGWLWIKMSTLEVINHQKSEASKQANPTTLKFPMWECNMLAHHLWPRGLSQVYVLQSHDPHTILSAIKENFFHLPKLSTSLVRTLRRQFCQEIYCWTHTAFPVWSAFLAKTCRRADCWGILGWKALDKFKAWIYINSSTRHDTSTKINCHLTQGWEAESDLPKPRCVTLAHKCMMGSKKKHMEQRRELEVMMGGSLPHSVHCSS